MRAAQASLVENWLAQTAVLHLASRRRMHRYHDHSGGSWISSMMNMEEEDSFLATYLWCLIAKSMLWRWEYRFLGNAIPDQVRLVAGLLRPAYRPGGSVAIPWLC
jgi:hypothetical protein